MVTWEHKNQDDKIIVVLSGDIDEFCDFTPLTSLRGNVVFDLQGIKRINSEGARLWVHLMRDLSPKVSQFSFVRCSVPVVIQMNMIFGFRGTAQIASFYAPYICETTGQEEERLLTKDLLNDPYTPPSFPCDGGVLELDDIPERYFAFMLEDPSS